MIGNSDVNNSSNSEEQLALVGEYGNRLLDQYSKLQNDYEHLMCQLNNSNQLRQTQDKIIANLRKDYQSNTKHQMEVNIKIEDLEIQRNKLKYALTQSNKQVQLLKDENLKLKEDVKSSQIQSENANKRVNMLERQLAKQSEEIELVATAIHKEQEQKAIIYVEKESSNNNNNNLDQDSLLKKFDRLTEESTTIKFQNQQLQQETQSLNRKVTELESLISRLQDDCESKQAEVSTTTTTTTTDQHQTTMDIEYSTSRKDTDSTTTATTKDTKTGRQDAAKLLMGGWLMKFTDGIKYRRYVTINPFNRNMLWSNRRSPNVKSVTLVGFEEVSNTSNDGGVFLLLKADTGEKVLFQAYSISDHNNWVVGLRSLF